MQHHADFTTFLHSHSQRTMQGPNRKKLIMTALWSLPFAIYAIAHEPSELIYHLFHIKFLIVPIISSIALNQNNKINEIWKRNHIWSRISIICCVYGISSFITLIVIAGGGYYSGDGGGSYALLLIPSIAVYAAIGIVVGIFMSFFTLYRKAKG